MRDVSPTGIMRATKRWLPRLPRHATTTDVEQRLKVEGGAAYSTPLQFTGPPALQDLSANRPFPLQVQLVTPPWQVDRTAPLPSSCAAGRGGGCIPDPEWLQSSRPTTDRRPRAREPSAGGPSDAGRGRLGRNGARRNPGDKRLEGGHLRVERQEKRPLVRAALSSRHVDVRDLANIG